MSSSQIVLRQELLKIQQGDQAAAARFVQQYEAELRREVRFRLRDQRLRRILDSMDICQSVLGVLFSKLSQGTFQFNSQDDLVRLLVRMVQNKVIDQSRRHYAACRDCTKTQSLDALPSSQAPADPKLTPAGQAAFTDLYEHLRGQLSPRERQIAELRASGRTWLEISQVLEEPADTLRKTLERACRRISRRLGPPND